MNDQVANLGQVKDEDEDVPSDLEAQEDAEKFIE
jgi:hypothetical protein